MKTGIVDVGGGLRGVYAAGIFDHCLDKTSNSISVSVYRQEAQMSLPT